MKTIYFIRHSAPFVEIENYKNNESIKWNEVNRNMILSVKGEENAKKICEIEELKSINEVYSSNSARAIGTAKYLAELNNKTIKLDNRINEREFGVDYIKELPEYYQKKSFDDKNFKIHNGESLNEVDRRLNSFISDVLNGECDKIVVVMHGVILLSYLQTICSDFSYDGSSFKIKFNNNIIVNGTLGNPSIYKIVYDDKNNIISVDNIS